MAKHEQNIPDLNAVKLDDKRAYLQIELPSHVCRYFIMKFGESDNTIHCHLDSFFGEYISGFCEHKYYRFRKTRAIKTPKAMLTLVLPNVLRAAHISITHLPTISNYLQKLFREHYYVFMEAGRLTAQSEMSVSTSFLEMYKIGHKEWDADTAYKAWKDYKKKIIIA